MAFSGTPPPRSAVKKVSVRHACTAGEWTPRRRCRTCGGRSGCRAVGSRMAECRWRRGADGGEREGEGEGEGQGLRTADHDGGPPCGRTAADTAPPSHIITHQHPPPPPPLPRRQRPLGIPLHIETRAHRRASGEAPPQHRPNTNALGHGATARRLLLSSLSCVSPPRDSAFRLSKHCLGTAAPRLADIGEKRWSTSRRAAPW